MTRINNRSADLPTTFIGTHHAHPDHPDPLLCTVSWAEHQRGKWSSRVWNNCSRSKDVCWPCGTRFVQKHSTFTRSIALWTCKSLSENGCFALTNLRAQLAGYCLCRHLCSKLTVLYSLLGNQQPYIPPDERPSSAASSFESTYSRLKNSSPVISSPLLPVPGPNILRTYRKPSRAAHLGTGSPQWERQRRISRWEYGFSLCCEDFNTHQALQSTALGWEGGGGAYRYVVQLHTLRMKTLSSLP